MRTLIIWSAIVVMLVGSIADAQKPDRSAPPKLGPPPVLRLGTIQHLKLANGIPVVLYEKHNVPLVQINLLVRAGSVCDPADKPGLASMTAAMMTEGAGTRDALTLSDAVEFLGATLTVNAAYHTFDVALNTPAAKLDSAIALMADVVLHPTFPQAELARQQTDRLTTLLQWRDEPRALSSLLFNHTLYGNHPYGRLPMGTEQSLRGMTPADLKEFHDRYFGANLATIIVVGDVSPQIILKKLNGAFGSWKAAKGTIPAMPEVHQVDSMKILLVDKPSAPQSEIRIGRLGAPRITDDYYTLVILNTVLGGSFSSRLNMNLREHHGYTYGAGSRFDFLPTTGPFRCNAGVQSAVTDSSLIEFMNELRAIVATPPTPAEVERARNLVALGFPSDFQTVDQIASQLEQMVIYGLPDDYFDKYIDNILSVTPQQVAAAAKKYIDPARLVIVVVGDRAQIEPKIANLHLGPITVVPIDDIVGKAPVLGEK